jgi:hypothetical protein
MHCYGIVDHSVVGRGELIGLYMNDTYILRLTARQEIVFSVWIGFWNRTYDED